MPPKSSKKRRVGNGTVADGVIKVELVKGQNDAQNLEFPTQNQEAWATVSAQWPGIENEEPLKVSEWGLSRTIQPEAHDQRPD